MGTNFLLIKLRPATAVETAAANKKRANAKKKDAVASTTTTTPASTKTVDTSKTKTIGTQTENQVKKENTNKVENRQSKALAAKKARLIKKRKDSGDTANRYLDKRSLDGRRTLSAKDLKKAQELGDFAALRGDPRGRGREADQAWKEVMKISALPKG